MHDLWTLVPLLLGQLFPGSRGGGAAGATGATGATGPSGVAAPVTVTISSAQLLASGVTPIQIIPAPGSGNAIVVLETFYSFTYGSSTYTGGGGSGLYYAPIGNGIPADTGDSSVCRSTSSAIALGLQASGGGIGTPADVGNAAVVYGPTSSAFAVGNGTLKITVCYYVAPL